MPEDFHRPRHVARDSRTHADYAQALKVVKLGEHDPDHRPCTTPMKISTKGQKMTFTLAVEGEGEIVMEVGSNKDTGRLVYTGMRLIIS